MSHHWTVSLRQGESDYRAGPLEPRVERRTAHVGAILPSTRGPGHALSLTTRLSAPQFRNFKIIYRRYAGLYFCICVDVNDNNLAYLEAIHNFVEVRGGGAMGTVRTPSVRMQGPQPGGRGPCFSAHIDASSGLCFPSVSLLFLSF